MHDPRTGRHQEGGERLVEVIVNGLAVASAKVRADGKRHDLHFVIPIERSSWVALRQFPQLHTNPVNVLVDEKPIRASPQSALWYAESVRLLWENRSQFIAAAERDEARQAYDRAIRFYELRAVESTDLRCVSAKWHVDFWHRPPVSYKPLLAKKPVGHTVRYEEPAKQLRILW